MHGSSPIPIGSDLLERPQLANLPRQRPELAAVFNRLERPQLADSPRQHPELAAVQSSSCPAQLA